MKDRSLQREHLNEKMRAFYSADTVSLPATGWIHAIRTALGMSMQQLGKRLGVTKQNIQNIERREKDGAITIKSLQELGAALDMRLVYGFVANDGTLDALVDRKARELAEKIVRRTAQSMKLEAQQNSAERIEKAIRERAEEIKREMPKLLWD